jgi:ZIP family zinc transporter
MDLIVVILAGAATALATGLGAIPVFLLGDRAAQLRPLLSAVAAAVMVLASAALLGPAIDDGSPATILAGVALRAPRWRSRWPRRATHVRGSSGRR